MNRMPKSNTALHPGRPSTSGGVSRRVVLKGLGGVTLALPFLEGLAPSRAAAAEGDPLPYAIFLRQANGVATEQSSDSIGDETEKFWPTSFGALTAATMAGRDIEEISEYAAKLLVLKGVNMEDFDYGDGHARGALQCLTGRGPVVSGVGGDSEATGESLDHRIGRQLNQAGRDSLFLYAGSSGGWLGGPCISYRGNNNRRTALHDPKSTYDSTFGELDGLSDDAKYLLNERKKSVNDLVRGQLQSLLASPKLSVRDKERLDLHLTSIRDVEAELVCQRSVSDEMVIDGLGEIYESNDGDNIFRVVRAHMDIAALAVACGITRSVAIQVGNGNDGSSQYRNRDTGEMMENYHYISHRRFSHDNEGGVIANSDQLHSMVDRHFGEAFKYLLDKLSSYKIGDGTLLDHGVSVWMNDLGNGPGHSSRNVPFILAGGCNGYFKQGEHLNLDDGNYDTINHTRVLNSIATAVGCTSEGKDYCDDLGDEGLDRSPHPDLEA